MTGQDKAHPNRVHTRRDPGVDPPSIALSLDLDLHMAEGDVTLFVDEADPARMFELHRLRGAFRIFDGVAPPWGTFASAQAAIIAGWASVDALLSDAQVGLVSDLPPLAALLDKSDPTGGAA